MDCFRGPVRWVQYAPSSNDPVYWFNGRNINPIFQSAGVSVENYQTRGWSTLCIYRVSLLHRGIFHCFVSDEEKCQMNFQLTVTGRNLQVTTLYTV